MTDTTDADAVDPGAAGDEAGYERGDDWVDIRMTDPEAGEWEMDTVVLDGRVQYVDLRIRPSLLASFVDCLVDDVDHATARQVLETVADRQDIRELTVPDA
jgi:hypothetical protein